MWVEFILPALIMSSAYRLWRAEKKSSYRQVSNIWRTESQYLNVSRLDLQLFLRNTFKPGVKPRMKM